MKIEPDCIDTPDYTDGNDQVRFTLLLSCLEAVKKFLDNYLRLPAGRVEFQSAMEKAHYTHAIIVLIKLSLCKGAHSRLGLESFPLHQACKVSFYLDALADHVDSVNDSMGGVRDGDSFMDFKTLMKLIKTWYERMVFLEQASDAAELKDMGPMQLADIARRESAMDFDLNSLDFSFFQGPEFGDGYCLRHELLLEHI